MTGCSLDHRVREARAFGNRARPPGGLGAELPEDFGCLGGYLSVFFQMEAHTDVIAG